MGKFSVLVGLSGGVDSSVAAALLLERGWTVTGVTMTLWDGPPAPAEGHARGACYGPGEAEDVASASAVAAALGIPFRTLHLAEAYRRGVLDHVRDEYRAGRTPNPCVRCNHLVKFGMLVESARREGLVFDAFATGHYARVERDAASGRMVLRKGLDASKDQSYFLYRLSQDQLAAVVFPLGDWTKERVREKARDLGLPVAERPESQDFLEEGAADLRVGDAGPGPVVDRLGKVLGEHAGIARYTVGQRKGLGIAAPEPLYVLALDAARNAVVVGPRSALGAGGLIADDLNWVAVPGLTGPRRAACRIRYRHREAPALLTPAGDAVLVQFEEPQPAVTPGQSAVFYDGDAVLGGGVIHEGWPANEESE
jgi:tRNA-specific 2-thiouridylase